MKICFSKTIPIKLICKIYIDDASDKLITQMCMQAYVAYAYGRLAINVEQFYIYLFLLKLQLITCIYIVISYNI